MKLVSSLPVLAYLSLTAAAASSASSKGPRAGQIKTIVTFGDSYSDIVLAGDNGTAWPLYVADYAKLTLHPFARAGATCSNNLTSKPFPSIFESQLPLFFQEKANGSLKIDQESTVYSLWIGTNDVGVGALLTGDQTKGVTLVDTVTCAINWVKTLYASGARNFIFQNMIPLEHTILYSPTSYPNKYWSFQRNTTEWAVFMNELTNSGNEIAKLMLTDLAPTLPGAHVGLFDSHTLFSDMIADPKKFLNGTAPVNTTGAISQCVFQLNEPNGPQVCTAAKGTDQDSFLWFDELHPSEQADRNVARGLANGILRISDKYFTWLT